MLKWIEALQYFQNSNDYRELFGIDGEKFEFEWNIFPGHTAVENLREIHTIMTGRNTRPEVFEDRIIFMSMFNDVDWTHDGNYKECFFEF